MNSGDRAASPTTITAGTRLGPYEVIAPIGAGGMGEVFKARDTRLDRSVAIKVLPAQFSNNAQLRIRFEREARAISQLNHPNICTLYDVGDSYFVMELLDGVTLAERLTKGPLPLDQVLRIGAQIADALDKAHRQGIIHRDLKPSNIMLTKSGAKLLDFGLARTDAPVVDASSATEHRPLTAEGSILGTFQYMAPEQLEGLPADARTDIFALGEMLYEMATAKRAFDGKTKTSLIAAIVSGQPAPISAVQPLTPGALEHVVQKCLEKDPDQRWQSAHDVAEELRWVADARPDIATARRAPVVPWAIAALLAIALVVLGILFARSHKQASVIETEILPPPARYSFNPQISPDGMKIAFPVADASIKRRIFLRTLDSSVYHAIGGTEEGFGPFWTRDSRTMYFFANGYLCRIGSGGGPVERIANLAASPRGGTITPDGVILVSAGGDIKRVDRSGAITVVARRRPDEIVRAWPWFLPDGKHFLFWSLGSGEAGEGTIRVASLDGKFERTLTRADSRAFYVPQGYLVFATANHVVAQRFDVGKLELTGEPVALTDNVTIAPVPGAILSVSDNDVLIYRSSPTVAGTSELTWYDSGGHQTGTLGSPGGYWDVALSHDGKKLAVRINNGGGTTGHLWIIDVDRNIPTRFTAGDEDQSAPIWSADDRTLFFTSATASEWKLCKRPIDSDRAVLLSRQPGREFISSLSPDGRFAFVQSQISSIGPSSHYDVFLMSLQDGKRTPFGDPRFSTESVKFSPDGHWVAYSSNESDREEIYVQRFPEGTSKTRISRDGANLPVWGRDGHTLYYHQLDDKIVAVDLRLGATVGIGTAHLGPTLRLKGGPNQQFDVAPDGKHILANTVVGEDNSPYTLVQNWTAKLK